MKRCLPLLATLSIGLAGCCSHYYELRGETLRLYLRSPTATRVQFASSLDGFRLQPARRDRGALWKVDLPYRDAFKYFYVVDGKVHLPACRLKESDDFGSQNCIFSPELPLTAYGLDNSMKVMETQ